MTIVYTVGSEEPLPRYPNGKIVDDGKVVILKEYPTCYMDGSCDCSILDHNRALYDVQLTDGWVYLCEDCWERFGDGLLGYGKAQRIVVTVGSLPLIRTRKDQIGNPRRCDGK